MSEYDPKSALKKFSEAGGFKGKPVGKRVGPSYDIKARANAICFPLAAWTQYAPELPEDIRTLTRTSKALKEHVRPDGAVFLGAFELPDQPESTVIVFGDAMTKHSDAQRYSISFRQRLMQRLEEQAQKKDEPPPTPELVS